ncbi:MAG: ABC transporter permease, partial [Verrucomicrobiales bacterium]|nr:ABC transporter permease [Verrucomicrobiales bacterium]
MNVLPVITRELRGEARRASNYWLRLAGAAAVLAVLLGLVAQMQGFAIGQGSRLFNSLNLTLFAALWLVVPLLTADCISAEKRGGTLGLLFLTPLKARDIVLAKGVVHTLRAVSLLLAALPVLAIPVLLGGVTWMDLARAALLDFSAVTLALTTGLLASCWCREWARATLLALGLSLASGA